MRREGHKTPCEPASENEKGRRLNIGAEGLQTKQ